MQLVRGPLFGGLHRADWAVFDGTQSWIESLVVRTALRGADACIGRGLGSEAAWMVRQALRVSPYDERLYRALLRATAAQGNRVGLRSTMAELLALAGEPGGYPAASPQVGTVERAAAGLPPSRDDQPLPWPAGRPACRRRAPRQAVGLRPAMARSSSGKSVARAAATGGGASYRGQMPVNWYAALVVIVLIGLASIALAKYNYNKVPAVVEPTTTTTWHAALAFDICGTMEPALAASPSSATTGLTSSGNGVLQIAPKTASEAGNNATLGKFAEGLHRADVDQHLGQVPVRQGAPVQERPEVRRRDTRRRQGRGGAGPLVGADDEDRRRTASSSRPGA